MGKTYYIVPTTGTYYDEVKADTPQDALCDFTDQMASDMSAYFAAADKKPMQYPHAYKYPNGKFERAISTIMATTVEDKGSKYYDKKAIEGLNLSNLEAVGHLQKAYDTVKAASWDNTVKCKKRFYKLLQGMTGFGCKQKSAFANFATNNLSPSKIYISAKEQDAVYKILDKSKIPYDTDTSGNIIVDNVYLSLALYNIRESGMRAELAEIHIEGVEK